MDKKEFEIDEHTKKSITAEFIEVSIDLRSCMKNDILICKNGLRLVYIQPLQEDSFYDHEVRHEATGIKATRTHTGRALKTTESELDVIEIIRKHE